MDIDQNPFTKNLSILIDPDFIKAYSLMSLGNMFDPEFEVNAQKNESNALHLQKFTQFKEAMSVVSSHLLEQIREHGIGEDFSTIIQTADKMTVNHSNKAENQPECGLCRTIRAKCRILYAVHDVHHD